MIKNILSYNGIPLLGKEIKEWIKFHTDNETSHTREAKYMLKFLNINDNLFYTVCKTEGTGSGEKHSYFSVIKIKDN